MKVIVHVNRGSQGTISLLESSCCYHVVPSTSIPLAEEDTQCWGTLEYPETIPISPFNHTNITSIVIYNGSTVYIIESVDSISRDGPDTPIYGIHYKNLNVSQSK